MKLTNKHNLPLSVAVWLASNTYNFVPKPNKFSATEMCKSIKAIVLGRRVDSANTEIDVSELLMSKMGTAVHDAIENVWTNPKKLQASLKMLGLEEQFKDVLVNPEMPDDGFLQDNVAYTEKRKERKLPNGVSISGEFDFCLNGQLEDFKQCKEFIFNSGMNDNKFRIQGSIYRWIHQDIITSNTTNITYLLKDWSPLRAMKDENYLQSGVQVNSLPLTSIEATEKSLLRKTNQIIECYELSEDELPECSNEYLGMTSPEYKYYSDPNKTSGRCSKNFKDDAPSAYAYLASKGKGVIIPVYVPTAECTFCKANSICEQYKRMKEDGEAL